MSGDVHVRFWESRGVRLPRVLHLPLYRLEGIFQRNGVELARSTMCDWMATVAELLEPIVGAMIRRVLASKVIGTDDTPVKVQDHKGKGVKTGHLWAYIGDRDNRFVVYDYTPTWGGDGPERFLRGLHIGLSPIRRLCRLQRAASPRPGGGRLLGSCPAEVPRLSDQRPRTLARGDRVDRPALRRRAGGPGRILGRRPADDRPRRAIAAGPGIVRGLARGGVEEGAAQEPDRRGDRLQPVELGGPDALPRSRRTCRSTTTRRRMRSGRSPSGGRTGCTWGAIAAARRRRPC